MAAFVDYGPTVTNSTYIQEIVFTATNCDSSYDFRFSAPAWIYAEGRRFLDRDSAKKYLNLLSSKRSWSCPYSVTPKYNKPHLPSVPIRRYDSRQSVTNKRRFYKQGLSR